MTSKTVTDMITQKETLELIVSCSNAKFCTPDTPLSELNINPLEAIEYLIQSGAEMSINHNFSLTVQYGRNVVISYTLFEFSKPIEEINTISDLANELTELKDEEGEIVLMENEYDLISDTYSDNGQYDSIFTIYNSWEYGIIDASKFLLKVKETYGVQIEKSAITKFYGTIEKLCVALTDRINRAINFHKET